MPHSSTVLDQIGNTPLVALHAISAGLPTPILAKCEHLNPSGSVKDRIAKAIVLDAEFRGVLQPGMTIVEASAGNTGMGLALVAATRGYSLVCVMPEKMSVDKRASLRAMGAKVVIADNAPPDSPDNFQNVARRLAETEGYFLAGQFFNPANPEIHCDTTGAELLQQCGGTIGAFVAGAGTGGTISGVGKALKAHNKNTLVILADPEGSGLAQWVETGSLGDSGSYLVEGIGSSAVPSNLHRELIDRAETISDAESFSMVKRLVREEGLYVGGSSGTAVAAALRVASSGLVKGPIVTLLPDSWDRYRSTSWMQKFGQVAEH